MEHRLEKNFFRKAFAQRVIPTRSIQTEYNIYYDVSMQTHPDDRAANRKEDMVKAISELSRKQVG